LQRIKKYSKEIKIILIGNKLDLNYKRKVSYKEGKEKAEQMGA